MNKFLFLCFVCFPLLSKKKKWNFSLKFSQVLQDLSFNEPVNFWVVEAALCSAPFHSKTSREGGNSWPQLWWNCRLSKQAFSTAAVFDSNARRHRRSQPQCRQAFLLYQSARARCVAKASKQTFHLYTDSPDIPFSQNLAWQRNCLQFWRLGSFP